MRSEWEAPRCSTTITFCDAVARSAGTARPQICGAERAPAHRERQAAGGEAGRPRPALTACRTPRPCRRELKAQRSAAGVSEGAFRKHGANMAKTWRQRTGGTLLRALGAAVPVQGGQDEQQHADTEADAHGDGGVQVALAVGPQALLRAVAVELQAGARRGVHRGHAGARAVAAAQRRGDTRHAVLNQPASTVRHGRVCTRNAGEAACGTGAQLSTHRECSRWR